MRPRRAGLRGALAAGVLLLLAACSDPPVTPARPPLWEISDREGRPVGWLLGTIHALPPGTRWRTQGIAMALSRADTLVVEVANLGSPDIARAFRARASNRAEGPILKRFPPADRGVLARALDEADLDAGELAPLESWAAALTLARAASPRSSADGVDRALIAEFAPRPVVELEGAAAQLDLFDTLPLPTQRALLLATAREAVESEADDAAAAAWARGDTTALAQLAQRGVLVDPRLRDALLVQRNRRWTARITAMLAAGRRPLVAVGAAHLVGSDGLPERLVAAGWRLRRIG